MSHTNLALGANWDGEWPEYVEVSHEGAGDGRRYVPERTWVSVDDRLPDSKGEYIVAFHPCCHDYVDEDVTVVGFDSFLGRTAWAKRKYQRVTHWMQEPEPPKEVER